MRKTTKTAALLLAAFSLASTAMAQEEVKVLPLAISSGLNADIIAEKTTTTSDYKSTETLKLGRNSYTAYFSNYATWFDGASYNGGYNAFFTNGDVNSTGGFDFTDADIEGYSGYQYFTGTDNNQYIIYHPDNTSNNALVLSADNKEGTLSLTTSDGLASFYASGISVMTTATEGGCTLNITLKNPEGETIGENLSLAVPDWYASTGSGSTTSQNLEPIKALMRVTVAGPESNQKSGQSTYLKVNYVNTGGSTSGRFILYKVSTPVTTDGQIDKVDITYEGKYNNTTTANSKTCIFTLSANVQELTEIASETSLDYLKHVEDGTTSEIKEEGKYKVNLIRTFVDGNWSPFVFNCPLTAKHIHEMFGNDVVLGKAERYTGRYVYFTSVDLTDDDATAVEPGEFYIIKGITLNTDGNDTETGAGIYTAYNVQYKAPTAAGTTKTFQNTKSGDNTSVTFHGTYVNGTKLAQDAYALSTDGKFYSYTDQPVINGFRFWFTDDNADDASNAKKNLAGLLFEDSTTGIVTPIDNSATHAADNVYSLDGRLVRRGTTSTTGLDKGIYIVAGKKVQVK